MNIIIIHKNNTHYLKYTLALIKLKFNVSNLYLIGDKSNLTLAEKNGFIHYSISDYNEQFNYIHRSPNGDEYEKFCIERWLILNNFVNKHKLKRVIYFDSDVFILDPELIIKYYYSNDFDVVKDSNLVTMPCIISFSKEGINYLSDCIKKFYNLNEDNVLDIYKKISTRNGSKKIHISDMCLIGDIFDEQSSIVAAINITKTYTNLKIKKIKFHPPNKWKEINEDTLNFITYIGLQGLPILNKDTKWVIKKYNLNQHCIWSNIYIIHLQGIGKRICEPLYYDIINNNNITIPKEMPTTIINSWN
jgi:hypothetical protein